MRRFLLAFTAIVALGGAIALGDYTATPGAGLTFASNVVGGVHYSKFALCDQTAPAAQCAAVSAAGAVKVDGSGATQPVSGTVAVSGTIPATQSGAWTVNPTTAANWGVGATGAVVIPNAHLSGMAQGGNLIAMTGTAGNLNVQCANCSGSGVSTTDEAAFVAATSLFAGTGGFFQTTPTNNALTNGQQGMWQMTANRAGFVNLRTAAGAELGVAAAPVQVSLANTATNATAVNVNVTNANTNGQATMANSSPVAIANNQSAIPVTLTSTTITGNVSTNPYPATAVPYTASATGTTAATTATLAGAAAVTTYLCGFSIRANATAAATGNATVTGTISATMNFTQWTAPNASGLGITEMIFSPCVPASAANTSIAVVSAAPGTGGVVSVTAWGYKL